MYRLKAIVPNFITSLNIVCGTLSVIFAFENQLSTAGYFILLAGVFDFFDGMTARLLNAYSELGKQLDSLADMLSFGLAPSIIAYQLMKVNLDIKSFQGVIDSNQWLFLLAIVLIPVCSGLRLAKFNIDTNQSDNFIGLPTPANALIYASLAIISINSPREPILLLVQEPFVFLIMIITTSLLLVSPLHMFSLKFKNLKFKANAIRFIFLLICLAIITFNSLNGFNNNNLTNTNPNFFTGIIYIIAKAIPLILIVYVLLSILNRVLNQNKKS